MATFSKRCALLVCSSSKQQKTKPFLLHITSIHLTLNQTQRDVLVNKTSFIVIYGFPTGQSKGQSGVHLRRIFL